MNKKKLIMAVILFIALIFVGIILPLLLRNKHNAPKGPQKEVTQTEKPVTTLAELPVITFQNFEKLKDFMADSKIEELRSLFPEYLQSAGIPDITSVTFFSERATYPSPNEVRLVFQLSDETSLPVYCDRDGRFLFGEEKHLFSEETITYEKITDDKLPDLLPDEVEKLQEGGYPDTASVPPAKEKED